MNLFLPARNLFQGISWRNPLINMALHIIDPVDYLIRVGAGRAYLPRYSTRVRSTGVLGDRLGGGRFAYSGDYLSQLLQEYTQLSPGSKVLEIGCGCGRTALSLAKFLNDGNFTGTDIDEVSIRACRENVVLARKRFRFDLMDIFNGVYNPAGQQSAETWIFPYPSKSFDVIFLISVFTHMLPGGVSNYIKEISRMLKPGGKVLCSTFLMDYGHEGYRVSFPYERENCRLYHESYPEKSVGYYLNFFDQAFARNGLHRLYEIHGPWRNLPVETEQSSNKLAQDILVYAK